MQKIGIALLFVLVIAAGMVKDRKPDQPIPVLTDTQFDSLFGPNSKKLPQLPACDTIKDDGQSHHCMLNDSVDMWTIPQKHE